MNFVGVFDSDARDEAILVVGVSNGCLASEVCCSSFREGESKTLIFRDFDGVTGGVGARRGVLTIFAERAPSITCKMSPPCVDARERSAGRVERILGIGEPSDIVPTCLDRRVLGCTEEEGRAALLRSYCGALLTLVG